MSGHDSKFDVKETHGKMFDHHGECVDDPSLKGFARYFGSSTIRGRANAAKATLFGIFAFVVYKKFTKASPNDVKTTKALDSVINAETA